jgi:5-methylcytosine-specific restriction endonuclease McrA
MMTLARPPDEWDAETTTAAALQTLRPAVDPITGSMVKADAPALEPSHVPENGWLSPRFQEAFRLGRVRSQQESGMRKSDFLEFLAQFQVYRHIGGAGDRTIPHAVVVAAFDAWEKSRSLGPIADWERVEAFLNEVPGQNVYDDAFLDWAQDVVENRGWWQSGDRYERWEVEKFRTLVAKHRRLNAEREAIRQRRYEAGRALSDAALRRRVFERDGHLCRSCQSAELLTVDHVVAVINGGTDDIDNLQTLCRTCNSSKGRKQSAAWRSRAKKEGLS